MDHSMDDDIYYSIELNHKGISIVYEGLRQAAEKWSGGKPQEQQDLMDMRDNFYRLLLEYRFENMN